MMARGWGERGDSRKARGDARPAKVDSTRARAGGGIEELFVQNEAVSLCLLLNRRAKTMRIIDFRAGASHAKRMFVLALAKREGIEKVYTLVERDEVSTWRKLGFSKEASIPAFYKRSDAFLLGSSVENADGLPDFNPFDDDADDVDAGPKPSPAQDFAEKTVAQAKRQVKALLDRQLPVAKLTVTTAADIQKPVERMVRSGRALTAFEPFGRDVERRYFQLTARNGFDVVAGVESQACFGNAFLELLTAPVTEHERLATVSGVRTLCDRLTADGVVSCFSLAPSDDLALATAFVFNGFRRTGLLLGHMTVGGVRKDAIVWSRKLNLPNES